MRKHYHRITRMSGNVAPLQATGVGYEELAMVEGEAGRSMAQVIRLSGDEVSLQVFAGTRGIGTQYRDSSERPSASASRRRCSAGSSTAPASPATGAAR